MTSMNLKLRRAKRTRLGRCLCRLLGEERGAVAMEYVVIALLVAAAVVGIVIVFGSRIASMFGGATKALSATETGQAAVAQEQASSREDHTGRANTALETGDTMRGSDGKGSGDDGNTNTGSND